MLRRLHRFCTQAGDLDTYAALLRQCKSVTEGRRLEAEIAASVHRGKRYLENLLVGMYGKCGSLWDARRIFDRIGNKNMFSWTLVIAAHAQNGYGWEVIHLYHAMDLDGIKMDDVTIVSVIAGCAAAGALAEGRMVHLRATACRFLTPVVRCALVNMYGKCGSPSEAKAVFDGIQDVDVVTWNAMLAAFAQNGQYKETCGLFEDMMADVAVSPDEVTYITILYACSCLGDLDRGERIHSMLVKNGLKLQGTLGNALVTMYYKCGRLNCARQVFERMVERTDTTWNAMITGNAQCGQAAEAVAFYGRMNQEGVKADTVTFMSVLDACSLCGNLEEGRKVHARIVENRLEQQVYVGTALVNMYGKCGSVEEARTVFRRMADKTLVTWTAMVSAFSQNGQSREALQTYREMDKLQIVPDNVTLISVVDACTRLGQLKAGKEVHERIASGGYDSDVRVSNSLITMYNKCGSLTGAKLMFDEARNKDVISWNAMIAAYSEHGQDKEAVDLFSEMQNIGVDPNDVTFVSILFACSHMGLLKDGWLHFISMSRDFGLADKLRVEHYVCMADLLGRAGWLREAGELLDCMPHEAGASAWTTLLSACNTHKNIALGEIVAERIFKLQPYDHGPYVLLSNMYSSVGRFKDAARIRRLMEENCGMTLTKTCVS